jgi:CBS domain-containing protein
VLVADGAELVGLITMQDLLDRLLGRPAAARAAL